MHSLSLVHTPQSLRLTLEPFTFHRSKQLFATFASGSYHPQGYNPKHQCQNYLQYLNINFPSQTICQTNNYPNIIFCQFRKIRQNKNELSNSCDLCSDTNLLFLPSTFFCFVASDSSKLRTKVIRDFKAYSICILKNNEVS